MLGAFVGDSLGSLLEFEEGDCADEDIEKAMRMPGGGPWGLAPGQVTDDSEIAMCLMRALLAGRGKLNIYQVALHYGIYMNSGPKCVGVNTRNTLGLLGD